MPVSKITILSMVLSIISIVILFVVLIVILVIYLQMLRWEKMPDNLLSIKNKLSGLHTDALSRNWELVNKHLKVVKASNHLLQLSSCAEIKQHQPSSTSGYYSIKLSSGQSISVFCNMDKVCGGITGGWTRIAKLNPDLCPDKFKTVRYQGAHKSCTFMYSVPGCSLITYKTSNIQFSHVCGKVRGYRIGTPDGFRGGVHKHSSLGSNSVDGIIISAGTHHIWTFTGINCVCGHAPFYMGHRFSCSHTFCDARRSFCELLFTNNRCGPYAPWFYTRLENYTSTDVQVRVCRDESSENEDIPIASLELYVQ